MNSDQNGNRVSKNIRQDSDGSWSCNVWFGSGRYGCTTLRRHAGYATRAQAKQADISDVPKGVAIVGYDC